MDRELDAPVGEEKHDVGPFESNILTGGSSIRNPGSRVVHCCMILPLLLVLSLAITSLSYFAVIDNKVGNVEHLPQGSGHCVLFGQWNGKNITLSSGHACVFSIFGEVAVAVLAALLIVWMIVKTSAGFYMASWLVVCEIPVFLIHMAFAFCVSITISIGLAFTCGEYKKYHTAGGCGNFTLPNPWERSVVFYDYLQKSMLTSWLVVVVLAIILSVQALMCVIFCLKCIRKSKHELIPVSDGESSSDGDSTEETMVPIAELEQR